MDEGRRLTPLHSQKCDEFVLIIGKCSNFCLDQKTIQLHDNSGYNEKQIFPAAPTQTTCCLQLQVNATYYSYAHIQIHTHKHTHTQKQMCVHRVHVYCVCV